jgi:hypothetical protein
MKYNSSILEKVAQSSLVLSWLKGLFCKKIFAATLLKKGPVNNDGALVPGKNFDAALAPAAPAPTLLHKVLSQLF